MKINVPENACPMFFFGLMLTDNLVEDLMKKQTSIQIKPLIKINHYATDLRGTLGQKSSKNEHLKMSISPLLCREKGLSPSCDFPILVKNHSLKMNI